MKFVFLKVLILSITLGNLCLADNLKFYKENNFEFTTNLSVIESNEIQLFLDFQTIETVKKNALLRSLDKQNMLEQYYSDIGEILVAKEIFLIDSPVEELNKSAYSSPQFQKILFPNVNFYDCNSNSCNAKQEVMGADMSFTADYVLNKDKINSYYSIEQFAHQWSMIFNNTLSYSKIEKYDAQRSLVTSFQILIIKSGLNLFKNKIVSKLKEQIIDFKSCFSSKRCQRGSL